MLFFKSSDKLSIKLSTKIPSASLFIMLTTIWTKSDLFWLNKLDFKISLIKLIKFCSCSCSVPSFV
ncbi:hypothetical protein NW739_05250 [Mycoplasmopsis felis]|uniref:hypothetical protein n=1 Tax=Mycoplasmopsis felis TaxID=33923 RepID=UPI0021DFF341|nr:hypothetical protein [Mycoplasmopsis felis]MCU9940082.1 hypothetical protein [Mycoplasmopsis felis]